ncbi:hypothetical protein [Paraburkholderia caledonica]|uniref:Quercetin dioxygenase-like cupin family protein n=1 Tax=Paraburkholderia caledonica TaxID=134536 RepID=A0AB73IBX9_9BURK|nr:quercetin dioxygenase-like cupin family protein [Paraburkholderia caledonica]
MNTSSMTSDAPIAGVQGFIVPMHCTDLPATMQFFIARLGFRLDAIFPADGPRNAILSRDGFRLRLGLDVHNGIDTLNVLCDDPAQLPGEISELVAPNGVVVRLMHANPPMMLPPTRQQLVLSHAGSDAHWSVGRAGMRYRDLLPERHGGAFIASHIRILEGGPVPDYVHFHKIRFQTIFCRKGWVRLVYEGQGEPFILEAGDCVLQPPEIRHRVLESSAGAEVIELGSPAEHITMAEHDMTLPNGVYDPDYDSTASVSCGMSPKMHRGNRGNRRDSSLQIQASGRLPMASPACASCVLWAMDSKPRACTTPSSASSSSSRAVSMSRRASSTGASRPTIASQFRATCPTHSRSAAPISNCWKSPCPPTSRSPEESLRCSSITRA